MPQLMTSIKKLVNRHIGDVISMSFGATEETFPSADAIRSLRYAFKSATRHGVTLVSSSGDTGPTDYKANGTDLYRHQVLSWPQSDPLVTSVGGTQLHLNASGTRIAPDNVWNDIPVGIDASGGGSQSHVFARPWYQRGVNTDAGAWRATPDISMTAAVDGGVDVFTSFAPDGPSWGIYGGTSASSPMFAGVTAVADQVAGRRFGLLNPKLYRLSTAHAPWNRRHHPWRQHLHADRRQQQPRVHRAGHQGASRVRHGKRRWDRRTVITWCTSWQVDEFRLAFILERC